MSDFAAAGLSPFLAHAVQIARGVTTCSPEQARRALACLDLTSLNDDDSDESIQALCARADTPVGPVAAVCVYPRFVATAKRALDGSPIKVATVVNFPSGEESEDSVAEATRQAVVDGADEIDVVLPYSAMLKGHAETATSMIAAVRRSAGPGRPVKTILEISRMPDLIIVAYASSLAIEAGTTFLKTSTGKVGDGATLEACAVMLNAILSSGKTHLGLKPSGGIRTAEDAASYLALADLIMGMNWAEPRRFRIGASSVVDALIAAAAGTGSIGNGGVTSGGSY